MWYPNGFHKAITRVQLPMELSVMNLIKEKNKKPKYRIFESKNYLGYSIFYVMKKGWIFWKNASSSTIGFSTLSEAERFVEDDIKLDKHKKRNVRLVKEI